MLVNIMFKSNKAKEQITLDEAEAKAILTAYKDFLSGKSKQKIICCSTMVLNLYDVSAIWLTELL